MIFDRDFIKFLEIVDFEVALNPVQQELLAYVKRWGADKKIVLAPRATPIYAVKWMGQMFFGRSVQELTDDMNAVFPGCAVVLDEENQRGILLGSPKLESLKKTFPEVPKPGRKKTKNELLRERFGADKRGRGRR